MTRDTTIEEVQRRLETQGDVEACLRSLEESRRELLALISNADQSRLSHRLDDGWNALMVAEHVALVEHSTARVIRWARRQAQGEGLRAFTASTGAWHPDGRPIAPEIVTPRGGLSLAELTARLESARLQLIEQVRESGALLDAPFTLAHPFFGELNGLGWLRVAAYHERHHLDQARRALASGDRESGSRE